LDLHSLRYSYITHLIEFDYPERFVRDQVGHAYGSTTAIYTHVSNEYRDRLAGPVAFAGRRIKAGLSGEACTVVSCLVASSVFVDESYVRANGVWRHAYRAVDQYGQAIDVLLSVSRDAAVGSCVRVKGAVAVAAVGDCHGSNRLAPYT
jgi:DDE domain/Phage integrase family